MQRTTLITITAIVLTTVLSSFTQQGCKGRSGVPDGPPRPATDKRNVEFLQKKLEQRTREMADLQSLTAKAQIYSESEGMKVSANANIIWIRDSVIWMNAKKFGFEALRVLITRDSVFTLNRLEKSYTAASLDGLRTQFALPEGDVFQMLQRTLLGLPAIPFKNSNTSSDITAEMHRLSSDFGNFSGEYRIEEGSFLLKNEIFVKKSDNTTAAIQFNKHQKIKDFTGLFSYLRRVDAFSPEYGKQAVDIELDEVQVNTQPSFRFEVPDHYTKG